MDFQTIENYALELNDSMNLAWLNSFPSPTTQMERGGQLYQNAITKNYNVITYSGEHGSVQSPNRSSVFNRLIADYHTHPYTSGYQGVSFSGGDIYGILSDAGNIYKEGFVKFVEGGSTRFALELVDAKQANSFAQGYSFETLTDYFNKVHIPSSKGADFSEKSRNAVRTFIQNHNTGLKYYESYDEQKLRFKEAP